jgi:hypothetical protein
MEPFAVNPKDAMDVNHAVNRLAAHAGLRGLLFLTAIGRLEPQHGGLIELKIGQKEVFIDVATTAGAFGPSLLAVLAHEISHKVLFDRRIRQEGDDLLRYEILTDVTAVYIGFGKLLLNGYEYAATKNDVERRVRFGYVSVEEVAFLHAMACRMREVPASSWLRGLSPFARRTMSIVTGDVKVRRHLDTAPMLVPQRTYLRPPKPSRPSDPHTRTSDSRTAGGEARNTVAGPESPLPIRKAISSEARRLRERLLTLVYGDERLASRLVAYEQRHQRTLEASYQAAIERLLRDRS